MFLEFLGSVYGQRDDKRCLKNVPGNFNKYSNILGQDLWNI